jgi:hypothetical protein
VVCVSTFTGSGVFVGPWGSATDLVEALTRQVVVGRASHVASRPTSLGSIDFLHCHSLPLLDRVEVPDLSVSGDTLDLWK